MNPKILAATKTQVECELYDNHPLRLVAAEGRRIHCISGVAWITFHGQPVDIFLRPGMAFTVPNNGLVLADGIGPCRIRVDLPRSFDYTQYRVWAQRLFARLRKGLRLGLN